LKEKALDGTLRTTRFGRGYGAETDYVMKMITEDLMIKVEHTLTVDSGRGKIYGLSSVHGSDSFLQKMHNILHLITQKSE
jgi:hypothetical protein